MSNSPHCAVSIGYKEKYIKDTVYTKFLGLQIDNNIKWKNHIDQMIPKLTAACYDAKLTSHISNIIPIKLIYLASFLYMMKYGTICWGNSFNSGKIFTLQKKIVTIIVDAKPITANIYFNELHCKQPRKFSNKFICI
jgi:hypothetical protein